MGIKKQIATAAILTLAIAGCASPEIPEATNTANPVPTSTKTAQQPPTPSTFVNPVVSPPPNRTSAIANGGIIQSTQIQPHLTEIRKGRTDPFAQIVTNPVTQMPSNSVQKLVPKLPPLPIPIKPQATQITPNTNQTVQTTQITPNTNQTVQNRTPRQISNNPTQIIKGNPKGKVTLMIKPKPALLKPVLPKLQPQVVTKAPITPLLPPQPQPDSAKAILVSGVVLIGKYPQAIIKVPDEKTSRYVQSGQRLANGVLIKRIEMNRGSEPVVILEQYGIEVAKAVEGKPTNSDPSKTTAVNPISMVTPL